MSWIEMPSSPVSAVITSSSAGIDAALPLRVQMGLDLVDEEGDMAVRLPVEEAAGFEVFAPRPDEQIGER
ncbi:MAG: hypothetical protein R3F65_05310 [bacterium]